MSKLYIGNATQQVQQFTFWMPEASRSMMQEIPIGGQAMILGREISIAACDAIIEQHRKYGLVSIDEATSSKRTTFHGVAYSIDKPIPYAKLLQMVDKYNSVLNARGKQLQTEAAIATNEFIEEQMFRRQLPGRLDAVEQTVEEVNRDNRDESPEISSGVRVVRAAGDDRRPRASRRQLARGG